MGAGLLECVLCLISQFDHPASCLCLKMWPLSILRWLPVAIMNFPSEPINQNELFLPSFWPLCFVTKSNQYTLLRSVVFHLLIQTYCVHYLEFEFILPLGRDLQAWGPSCHGHFLCKENSLSALTHSGNGRGTHLTFSHLSFPRFNLLRDYLLQ